MEQVVSEAPRGTFDAPAFYAAMDAERQARGLLWKDVAKQAGISPSTLTRLAQGRRPDVDSLASLVDWAGLAADAFVRRVHHDVAPSSISQISTYLRGDRNLTPEAATALDELIKATYARLSSRPQ